MTQKGVSKIVARRLLEEIGFFTGALYAKRVVPDNTPRSTKYGKLQHQPQQQKRVPPQTAVELLQKKEKVNQPQEEEPGQHQIELQNPQQLIEAET